MWQLQGHLFVRVGGGWLAGEEFVRKNAPVEARKLGCAADEVVELTRIGDDLALAERQLRRAKGRAS